MRLVFYGAIANQMKSQRVFATQVVIVAVSMIGLGIVADAAPALT